jgi:hypothetical protein
MSSSPTIPVAGPHPEVHVSAGASGGAAIVGSRHDLVRQGRFAGLLYLAIAALGAFAQVVRLSVYVPGDAGTTAANVAANAPLLRLSFVADLIQNLVFLLLALVLYRLFASAGRGTARALVVFVAVSVSIAMVNMVSQLAAVIVATTPSYGTAFGQGGSDALVLLLMDMQHYGYLVAQLSWLWLLALGLLGYRSGMLPRWLSVLLMLATVSYVLHALSQFLATGAVAQISAAVFVVPETLIELALLAYLLIRGVRPPRLTLGAAPVAD